MTQRAYARQMANDFWQWRLMGEDGQWDQAHAGEGDLLTLSESMPEANSVMMVLAGQHAVSCHVAVETKEKRYLAQLLPSELEEHIIGDIDDLHITFSAVDSGKIPVVYTNHSAVETALSDLADARCDVNYCLPDYLLLKREDNGATICFDGHQVMAHFSEGNGFTADASMAPLIFTDLANKADIQGNIRLVAETEEQLSILASWLPESWTQEPVLSDVVDPEEVSTDPGLVEGLDEEPTAISPAASTVRSVHYNLGTFWDCIDSNLVKSDFNLRSGRFSRRLPFDRWWKTWQWPVSVVAAAFVLALAVSFMEMMVAKKEVKALRQEVNSVYLKAIPNGRLGDPVGALRSKLKTVNKGAQSSNVIPLVGGVAEAMRNIPSIKLRRFQYNAARQELQVNLEAASFDDVNAFRTGLGKSGLEAAPPKTTARGEGYQATLKVKESGQ